jgi:hypothetical protein
MKNFMLTICLFAVAMFMCGCQNEQNTVTQASTSRQHQDCCSGFETIADSQWSHEEVHLLTEIKYCLWNNQVSVHPVGESTLKDLEFPTEKFGIVSGNRVDRPHVMEFRFTLQNNVSFYASHYLPVMYSVELAGKMYFEDDINILNKNSNGEIPNFDSYRKMYHEVLRDIVRTRISQRIEKIKALSFAEN